MYIREVCLKKNIKRNSANKFNKIWIAFDNPFQLA